MASLKDIADRVGISKAAVSRILNGKGSFSKETVFKVEKVARELNYKLPNASEDSADNSNVIGLIVPLNHKPYFGVLSAQVEIAAYDYGCSLMLCSSAYENLSSPEFAAWLRKNRISGLLIGVMLNNPTQITELGIPCVSVGLEISSDIPSVCADNLSIGRLAGRHLLSRKCQNLLYISNNQGGLKNDLRYKGFYEELECHQKIAWPAILSDEITDQDGITEMITNMLMKHPEADGIFTESNTLALECIRILQDLGYQIPEEIKVVGCGSPHFSVYSVPRLTLVKENTDLIAKKAVSMLVDLMEGQESAEKHLQIPVSLEINQTS
ncbi:MAG: LacI family DNA-binding transcriptional regulator [Allobaculum sp.]